MIQICNLRKEKTSKQYDVKCDRSSVLGNPFPMKTEAKRDECCEQYSQRFLSIMDKPDEFKKFHKEMQRLLAIYRLHGKLRLFCWCAPKRCHTETIKAWIEEQK